jgi:hypothetical protein
MDGYYPYTFRIYLANDRHKLPALVTTVTNFQLPLKVRSLLTSWEPSASKQGLSSVELVNTLIVAFEMFVDFGNDIQSYQKLNKVKTDESFRS